MLSISEQRRLRDLAAADQQASARAHGHQCSYDCEDWLELPTLDSSHCERSPLVDLGQTGAFNVAVILSALFWGGVLVIGCGIAEWLSR